MFAEDTRVADKLLIIDLPRPPSVLHSLQLSPMLPFTMTPLLHDGLISSLRAHSRSALRALARHADPAIQVKLRGGSLLNSPMTPQRQIVVATRG